MRERGGVEALLRAHTGSPAERRILSGTSLDFAKEEMGHWGVRSSEDPLASVFGWLRDGEIAATEADVLGKVWKV
ncbi:hypothetical protein SRHO_G00195150 [Serrasalmus rhombeus]